MIIRDFFIYLFIMAGVTYLIRVLPFVIFKGKITNTFIKSFLYYVPYAVLGQDVQQSSLNLSNIHLQYITEKNIFLFTLLKTWLVIN